MHGEADGVHLLVCLHSETATDVLDGDVRQLRSNGKDVLAGHLCVWWSLESAGELHVGGVGGLGEGSHGWSREIFIPDGFCLDGVRWTDLEHGRADGTTE